MAKKQTEELSAEQMLNAQEVEQPQVGTSNDDFANMEGFMNFEELVGTEVESKLKFEPRPELGMLTKAVFLGATYTENHAPETDEKTGLASTWEYAGLELPSLKLSFKQVPTPEDPYDRFLDVYISPFTNRTKNGDQIDPKQIANHYTWEYQKLRHIANAFVDHANFDKAWKVMPINPLMEPIARIENLRKYYKHWADLFNGKGGKGFEDQVNWLKVVADSRTGSFYTLPDFVKEGFIEKVKKNLKPSIRITPSDVLDLKARKSAKKDSAGTSTTTSDSPQMSSKVEDMLNEYED